MRYPIEYERFLAHYEGDCEALYQAATTLEAHLEGALDDKHPLVRSLRSIVSMLEPEGYDAAQA